MDKKQIRAHCRQLRDALLPEQVAAASAQVCRQLAAWSVFQQAQTVMTYLAFRNEIDLSPLLADLTKRWIIPRIVGKPAPRLVLHPYEPARLVRHRFGMLEPDPTLPVAQPDELDLILAPGLAFDRRGFRLGLGGGFYDRFLPLARAPKVGIAYSALILDAVPVETHDQPMDYIVSEEGIFPHTKPGAA